MNIRMALASVTLLFVGSAQASLVWQPAPPEKQPATANQGGHAGHDSPRGGKAFVLSGGTDAEAELWLPTRVRRPLAVDDGGRVTVRGTGLNSYHMLFAKKQSGLHEEVAMRYLYLQGKPSDVSPSELVGAPKATLDITPVPLTREHQSYSSKKPASYLVRFKGEPLAANPVLLTTSNGSEINATTDELGIVSLTLPDDFSDVQPGRSNNQAADFAIATSLERDGRRYHTTVSAPYYVSPSHWQSFTGGLLAMFAGAVSGLLVLQRARNTANQKTAGEA